MTELSTPSSAYDLLEVLERVEVDKYVQYAINEQHRKRERIVHAIHLPIPSEHVRRSRNALSKPLVRAAIAEKLNEAAAEQDVSPDRIIREHQNLAFSNIGDYIQLGNFGDITVKPIYEIERTKMQAVKKLVTIPTPYGIRTEIVLHDKQSSLKVLTELVGLVAPDTPAPLRDYVKPKTKAVDNDSGETSEQAYSKLLENMSCRT